jgi:hypothetical protein
MGDHPGLFWVSGLLFVTSGLVTRPVDQKRCEPLRPAENREVIDLQATFGAPPP